MVELSEMVQISSYELTVLAFFVVEVLDAVCRGTLVAYLCQCAHCVIANVSASLSPLFFMSASACACGCVVVVAVEVVLWGADGLSGSLGPGGTALVNNSDEAHYQGSADFSLIPP